MHHLVFEINFLLHSVNLIVIIPLPTLLISPTPAHLFHHHHSHHPLLPLFFILKLKIHLYTNPSHHSPNPLDCLNHGLGTFSVLVFYFIILF